MNDSLYTPLIAGIDTVEIGYCVSDYNIISEEWLEIQMAKARAQSTLYTKGTGINFKGYDLLVLRYSGGGRYKYILVNDDLNIRIRDDAQSGRHFPEIQVRFSSALLWRHGWESAIKKVDDWIRSFAVIVETKITRLDVMVDIMGELPILTQQLKEAVTRTRKKGIFSVCERYSEGWTQTGYRIGQKELLCRIYDKSREIMKSDKKWFEPLWNTHGWVKGNHVTRIEFQCRRKVLREININNIDNLFQHVPDLWKYLTNEWLTIRLFESNSRRTRWELSDFWKSVQSAVDLFGKVKGVSRIKQLQAKSINLENNARGYALNLIALAAVSLGQNDIFYGIKYFESKVRSWIDGPGFEEEVKRRMLNYESME